MVGTICPMVHGARQAHQKIAIIVTHALGSTVGAAIVGMIAGMIGNMLQFPRFGASGLTLVGVFSTIYALGDGTFADLPHPQSSLRVPPDWRRFGPVLAALFYGLALGVAVGTPIQVSSFYIVLVWSAALGKPFIAAAVFLGFGIGRVIPILALSRFDVSTTQVKVNAMSWNLDVIKLANQCALAFAAVVLFFNVWSRWSV